MLYMVTCIPSIYPIHVSIYIYIPAPWILWDFSTRAHQNHQTGLTKARRIHRLTIHQRPNVGILLPEARELCNQLLVKGLRKKQGENCARKTVACYSRSCWNARSLLSKVTKATKVFDVGKIRQCSRLRVIS